MADPDDPSTLYASRLSGLSNGSWLTGQVCRSTDTGATWTVVSPKEWVDAVVEITVDPYAPSNVYAVQANDAGPLAVSRSLDGGTTWEKVGLEGVGQYLGDLLFDPRSPDTLYVVTSQVIENLPAAGVYRSIDKGATWENIIGELPDTELGEIVIDPAPDGALYAVMESGLFVWVPGDD